MANKLKNKVDKERTFPRKYLKKTINALFIKKKKEKKKYQITN